MTTIARDSNNDVSIRNGRIVIVSGLEAYKNILQSAALTLRGEIQLDINRGIPYMETIFDGHDKFLQWKSALFDAIRSYDFVINITDFSYTLSYKDKRVDYSMVVLTDLGEVVIDNYT